MVARTVDAIYGHVETLNDIRDINKKIRSEMESVPDQAHLTELKKRSDYLCTLTFSPAWRKRFGEKASQFLEVAKEENRKTVRKANMIARRMGWDVQYDPWGDD